jgi:hypothetical protein
VNLHAGERGKISSRAGYGEVHRVGDHVAQVKQFERALVRDNGRLLANGKPSSQDVLSERRGILAIAVEASADANKPASLDVVGE